MSPTFGWLVNSETTSLFSQYILGESLQRFLGPLRRTARARGVKRVQPLDELHGRGDLLGEDVEHLRNDVGAPAG